MLFLSLIVIILLLRNRWLRERKKKRSLSKEKVQLTEEKEHIEQLNAELSSELSAAKQQLVSASTILHNKTEVISAIDELVKEIESNPEADNEFNQEQIRSLKSKVIQAKQTDQSWEDFKVHFEGLHHNFFKELFRKHPDLNSNELRLAAYLFMQLSAKEISQLLNIQSDTFRKRKQRLKEKIGLEKEQNLSIYLFNLLQ